MENIRKNAREEIVKQRRQQPSIFTPSGDNSNGTGQTFDHLEDSPNKAELVAKITEFNEIEVHEFGKSELNEIANTLKNGEL